MPRPDLRDNDQLRPVTITKDYLSHNPHSVLIEFGETKVLCAATIEENVPPFKKGKGEGWVTAPEWAGPFAGTLAGVAMFLAV